MKKKNLISIVLIIAILLIGTGCGPSPDQATATAAAIVAATQTAQPTPTPEPTDTPTPEPTDTPAPTDTPTPEPTDTPTPEPTDTPTPEPTDIPLEDYEHPSGAFSLSVPSDWEMISEDEASVNFAESEMTSLLANFGAEEADISEDPRAYVDLFMEGFTSSSGLTEDDYEVITDESEADGSSYTVLAIDTPDDGEIRVHFFLRPEEETVFALAFVTPQFETFEAMWEEIRDSFTVDPEAALAAIEALEPVASAETEPAETEPAEVESEPAPTEDESSPAESATLEGFTYMGQEAWDQAIAAFQEAIQLDPQLGLAYEGLGYSYISGPGDLEKARDALQTYLDLTPGAEDRADVEETIAQIDEILAGGGSSGDPLVDQLRQIEIPEGKALFYFANYSGETWNVDIGPNFMQAPPPPGPDQSFQLTTIFIDPGTFTWQAHSADAGYYITDGSGNRAFEFTVGAGEVYGTQCCN